MRDNHWFSIGTTGLAMFSMFFGAGNVIFPLMIGFNVKEMISFAALGLLLGAVCLPFLGLFSMILCEGDISRFFNKLGKPLGFIIGFFIISLLGPIGASPRCIALACATLNASGLSVSELAFSIIASILIFALALRKNKIVPLLGLILTPALVLLLGFMVVKASLTAETLQRSEFSPFESFYFGLKEGYLTMDLMAALFFAPIVLATLKQVNNSPYSLIKRAFISSVIGGSLLAITYIGFSYAAAAHSLSLESAQSEDLLALIAFKVLGEHSALIISLLVILACLTTAIALLSVFASFVESTFPKSWNITYKKALFLAVSFTGYMSTIKFSGISSLVSPFLDILYPMLIIICLLHISDYLKARTTTPLKT